MVEKRSKRVANPHFPALRSSPTPASGATRQKQILHSFTRVFGTTGGHHNETVADNVYLDLVTGMGPAKK